MSETQLLLRAADDTQPEKQIEYTINLNVDDSDQMENKPPAVHRCSKWVQYFIFTIFIVLISTGCLFVYRWDNGATNKKVTIPNYRHTATTVAGHVENTDERPPTNIKLKNFPRFVKKFKEKIEKTRTNIGKRPPIKPKLKKFPRLVKEIKQKVVANQKNLHPRLVNELKLKL